MYLCVSVYVCVFFVHVCVFLCICVCVQQHRHSLGFTILPYPAGSQGLRTISDSNDSLPGWEHIYPKSKSGTGQRWRLEIVYSVRGQKKNTSTVLTHTVKRIRPTYILGIRICAGIISGCRQYDENTLKEAQWWWWWWWYDAIGAFRREWNVGRRERTSTPEYARPLPHLDNLAIWHLQEVKTIEIESHLRIFSWCASQVNLYLIQVQVLLKNIWPGEHWPILRGRVDDLDRRRWRWCCEKNRELWALLSRSFNTNS